MFKLYQLKTRYAVNRLISKFRMFHNLQHQSSCVRGRISYPEFDKILALALDFLCVKYHLPIDGFVYEHLGTDQTHDCCQLVNKQLATTGDRTSTCVPEEICIFNPIENLVEDGLVR